MNVIEKQVPLTTQDYEKLTATKGGGLGCFLLFAIAALAVSGFIYLLINDVYGGYFALANGWRLPTGLVVVPFSLFLIVIAFFIYRRYSGKAGRDISRGIKNVATSPVLKQYTEDLDPGRRTKFSNTTAYMINIAGTEYDVKEEDYAKFKVGMPVEVHTAVESGEFLGIYDPSNGNMLCEELY